MQGSAKIELVIQKSRFIGHCMPAVDEETVQEHLGLARKQYYDASHNVYAYSLGELGNTARFSDDGEPGGTAGMPVLEVIRQKGVTDTLVIVTRYFGGVLLGAGGLVRAYAKAASLAIEAAGVVRLEPGSEIRLTVDYPLYGALEPLVREYAADVQSEFSDRITMRLKLRQDRLEPFFTRVSDLTCGRVRPEITGECIIRIR